MRGYRNDLAYIHDAGFRDYARNAAPGLLRLLRREGAGRGLVVDLGCGSGRWAAVLTRAGCQVLGVDQSPAMIRLARRIAPQARFQVGSLWSVRLPACDAVTSVGECLNYCFDPRNSRRELRRLFRRVYQALRPGGVFIFDNAEPGRLPDRPQKTWVEAADWAILVSVDGDRKRRLLRRRITSFRKTGGLYRCSREIHTLKLYRARDLIADLRRCGFRARKLAGYGRFRLLPGMAAVLAIKP